MRHLLILFLVCTFLSACTLLWPERTPVGGSVWLVSQADLHEAIAAVRSSGPGFSRAPVDHVVVDSRSKLYVYFANRDYRDGATVERVDGRWRYVGIAGQKIICD